MPVGYPPQPVYPLAIDSDRTLFLVFNTSEAKLTADNSAWADEIEIEPVDDNEPEQWAENGFANIEGELFYYDAVETNSAGKINKLKRCARNIGGSKTKFNPTIGPCGPTMVRGFVIAEHHNQLVDAVIATERFLIDLEDRVDRLVDEPPCIDDAFCPEINFAFEVDDDASSNCEGTVTFFDITVNGDFNTFRLDFGDGESTTTDRSGTHIFPPNSTIDPVVTITNDRCSVIQTPIERTEPSEPPTVAPEETFEIPIPPPPDFPEITLPDCEIPVPEIEFPQVIFPCLDVGPIGPIDIPSVIIIQPPLNIPSIIVFGPVEIPSIIVFGPAPSFSPIGFGPAPSFSPIGFGPAPSFSPIGFGPAPSFSPIGFGPAPTFSPISFGPAPNFSPISFGPAPSFSPISFGPAPSFSPIDFGPTPNLSPIDFGPAPNFSPIDFGPAPAFSPIDFGPTPNLSPIDFGPAPNFSPIDFGPAPTFSPIDFGPAPNFSPIDFGPAPNFSPIAFGPAPTFSPIAFGPAPELGPVEFGAAPSISPVEFGTAPSISPIQFGAAPTLSPIAFGPAPELGPVQFGPAPSISPVEFGPAPSISPVQFGTPPEVSVNWGSPPTCSCTVTVSCPGGSPLMFQAQDTDSEEFIDGFEPVYDASTELGIPTEIKIIAPKFPNIRVVHDLPVDIKLDVPEIPNIKLEVPSEFPRQITIVSEAVIPEKIQLEIAAGAIPEFIKLDASLIPESIQLLAPEFPDQIQVVGFPESIPVTGIPESIEVKMPKEIVARLEVPENLEVPLVYKGGPVPIQFDTSNLLGDGDHPCFALVPCEPKK